MKPVELTVETFYELRVTFIRQRNRRFSDIRIAKYSNHSLCHQLSETSLRAYILLKRQIKVDYALTLSRPTSGSACLLWLLTYSRIELTCFPAFHMVRVQPI
jgi:hypothetical protein